MRNPFGSKKEEVVHELLEPSSGERKSKPEQSPQSILDTRRVNPVLLENMFATEPILGAGAVTWQSLIEDSGFDVLCNDSFVQDEADDIRQYTTFYDELVEKCPLHFVIFGNFWLEHIFNSSKKKIVEFLAVDPKNMIGFKPITRGSDVVDVDNLGRPIAYRMETSSGKITDFKPNVQMSFRPLIQVTHTQTGLGMVEQVYKDSELKENLEQARTQAAYNAAWPKPIVGYGTDIFIANAEMKKNAEQLAAEVADANKAWVTYPKTQYEIDWPPSVALQDEIVNQLMYTTKLQASILGIPFAVLMQSGVGEGRATLETLVDFFEYRFRGFQKKMKPHDIIKNVLKVNQPQIKESQYKTLHTEYGVLSHKAAKEFVMKIQRLAKTEMIDPEDEEVKKKVRQALGIKEIRHLNKVADKEMIDYEKLRDRQRKI